MAIVTLRPQTGFKAAGDGTVWANGSWDTDIFQDGSDLIFDFAQTLQGPNALGWISMQLTTFTEPNWAGATSVKVRVRTAVTAPVNDPWNQTGALTTSANGPLVAGTSQPALVSVLGAGNWAWYEFDVGLSTADTVASYSGAWVTIPTEHSASMGNDNNFLDMSEIEVVIDYKVNATVNTGLIFRQFTVGSTVTAQGNAIGTFPIDTVAVPNDGDAINVPGGTDATPTPAAAPVVVTPQTVNAIPFDSGFTNIDATIIEGMTNGPTTYQVFAPNLEIGDANGVTFTDTNILTSLTTIGQSVRIPGGAPEGYIDIMFPDFDTQTSSLYSAILFGFAYTSNTWIGSKLTASTRLISYDDSDVAQESFMGVVDPNAEYFSAQATVRWAASWSYNWSPAGARDFDDLPGNGRLYIRLKGPTNNAADYVDIYRIYAKVAYGPFHFLNDDGHIFSEQNTTGASESVLPTNPSSFSGTTIISRRDANQVAINGSGYQRITNSNDALVTVKMNPTVNLTGIPTSCELQMNIRLPSGANSLTQQYMRGQIVNGAGELLAGHDNGFGTIGLAQADSPSTTMTTTYQTYRIGWEEEIDDFNYIDDTKTLADWDDAYIQFRLTKDYDVGCQVASISMKLTQVVTDNKITQPGAVTTITDVLQVTASGNGGGGPIDGTRFPNTVPAVAEPLEPTLSGDIVTPYQLVLQDVDSRHEIDSTVKLKGEWGPTADISNDGTVFGGTNPWEVLDSGLSSKIAVNGYVHLAHNEVCKVEMPVSLDLTDTVVGIRMYLMYRFTGTLVDDTVYVNVNLTSADETENYGGYRDFAFDLGALGDNFTFRTGTNSHEPHFQTDPSSTVVGVGWDNADNKFADAICVIDCEPVGLPNGDDGIELDVAWVTYNAYVYKTALPIDFHLQYQSGVDILDYLNYAWNVTGLDDGTATNNFVVPLYANCPPVDGLNWKTTHAFRLGDLVDPGGDFLYAAGVYVTDDSRTNTSNTTEGGIRAGYKLTKADGTLLAALNVSGDPQPGILREGGDDFLGESQIFFDYVDTLATDADWNDAWLHISLRMEGALPATKMWYHSLSVTVLGGGPNATHLGTAIPITAFPLDPDVFGSGGVQTTPDTIDVFTTEELPDAGAGAEVTAPVADTTVLLWTPITETVTDDTATPDEALLTADPLAPTISTQQDANVFGFLLELESFPLPPLIELDQTAEPVAIPVVTSMLTPTPRAGATVTETAIGLLVDLPSVTLTYSVQKLTQTILTSATPQQVTPGGGQSATLNVLEAILTNPAVIAQGTVATSPDQAVVDLVPLQPVLSAGTDRGVAVIDITGTPLIPDLVVGVSKTIRPSTVALLVSMAGHTATAGSLIPVGVIITNLTTFDPDLFAGSVANPDVIAQVVTLDSVTAEGGGTAPLTEIDAQTGVPTPDVTVGSQLNPDAIDATATPLDPTVGDAISGQRNPVAIPVIADPLQVIPNQGGNKVAPVVSLPTNVLLPVVEDDVTATPSPATSLLEATLGAPTISNGTTAATQAILGTFSLDPVDVSYGQATAPGTATCTVSMGAVDVIGGLSDLATPATILSQVSFPAATLSGGQTATVAKIATAVLLNAVQTGFGRDVQVTEIAVTATPLQVSIFNIPDEDATVNVVTISAVATVQEGTVLTFVDASIEIVIEDVDPMSVFGREWGIRTGQDGQFGNKQPRTYEGGPSTFGGSGGTYFEGS